MGVERYGYDSMGLLGVFLASAAVVV